MDYIIEPADNFDIKIKACDVPGIGGELGFGLSIAKSDIDNIIQQLDNILEMYPVI